MEYKLAFMWHLGQFFGTHAHQICQSNSCHWYISTIHGTRLK